MSNEVFCLRLKKNAPAMQKAPFPGSLGDKIHKNISQEAWDLWLAQQTMLINEYRLNLLDTEAREFLKQQMQEFLFEGQDKTPQAHTKE
jgi:Fe-S cluster biosynthesis and repair protein YggX